MQCIIQMIHYLLLYIALYHPDHILHSDNIQQYISSVSSGRENRWAWEVLATVFNVAYLYQEELEVGRNPDDPLQCYVFSKFVLSPMLFYPYF